MHDECRTKSDMPIRLFLHPVSAAW